MFAKVLETMEEVMSELPKGCFKFIDHKRIIRKDIKNERLCWTEVSTERAICHSAILEPIRKFFTPCWRKPDYYRVRSTTTYEMYSPRCTYIWGETDLTGLEWHFSSKDDAHNFMAENFFRA